MTRKVFMKKLMGYLKNIPEEERVDIEKFYSEMFDEEGIGENDEVPEHYENPKKIAFDIIGDTVEMETEKKDKSREKSKRIVFGDFSIFRLLSGLSVLIPIVVTIAILFALSICLLIIGIILLPIGLIFNFLLYSKVMTFILGITVSLGIIMFIMNFVYKRYRRKNRRKNSKYTSDYYRKVYDDIDMDDIEIKLGGLENLTKLNKLKKLKKLEKLDRLFDDKKDDFDEGGEDMSSGKEFSANSSELLYFEDVDRIICEIDRLNVLIMESDDERVVVDAGNISDRDIICKLKGDKLKILGETNISIMKDRLDFEELEKLIIYIPENLNLRVDINAGKLKISGVIVENLAVELNAGTVEIDDITAENIKIELNAGNINCEEIQSETINLNVDAGRLDISDVNTEELKLEVNAGKIMIEDVEISAGEIEVNAGSISGNLTFDENLDIEVNVGSLSLDLENDDEDIRYTLEKTMGSASISREFTRVYKDEEANLNVKVAMGSVKLF